MGRNPKHTPHARRRLAPVFDRFPRSEQFLAESVHHSSVACNSRRLRSAPARRIRPLFPLRRIKARRGLLPSLARPRSQTTPAGAGKRAVSRQDGAYESQKQPSPGRPWRTARESTAVPWIALAGRWSPQSGISLPAGGAASGKCPAVGVGRQPARLRMRLLLPLALGQLPGSGALSAR
jgi:hypothetical protein